MKFTHMLASAAIVVSMPVFAFAAAHMDVETLTCADFIAMDEEGRMEATEAMSMAAMEAEGTAAEEMSDEDKMAMNEESIQRTIATCGDKDEMRAMDAMTADG